MYPTGQMSGSLPSKWNRSWSVSAFFNEWLVKFSAGSGMYDRPTLFTVVLQACHVGAEKGREFPGTPCAVTLVTELVIQHVRLDFNLEKTNIKILSCSSEKQM